MKICVTNRHLCKGDFYKTIKRAAETADMIILREKDLPPEKYREYAEHVQQICREKKRLFCVNTFSEVAEELESDLLQLSYFSFMNYEKKTIRTGVSVHSLSEAVSAEKKGADFLIAGHIFQTDCKKDLAPRGVKFLTEIVSNVEIPVYAIGGINPQNEHLIYECGANGICIMSGYMK